MKCKKIVVRKKDIRVGNRQAPTGCPIALAVGRVFKGEIVSVGTDTVSIGDIDYKLPKKAQKFISRFDYQEKVKPFTFCVRVAKPDTEVSC